MATKKTKKQVKKASNSNKNSQISTTMEEGTQPTPLMLHNSKDEYTLGH